MYDIDTVRAHQRAAAKSNLPWECDCVHCREVKRRPTDKRLKAYALYAVKSEVADPYHGRLSSYSRDAVINDVLNHFEGLTNSDEDRELIEDAVREAELTINAEGL